MQTVNKRLFDAVMNSDPHELQVALHAGADINLKHFQTNLLSLSSDANTTKTLLDNNININISNFYLFPRFDQILVLFVNQGRKFITIRSEEKVFSLLVTEKHFNLFVKGLIRPLDPSLLRFASNHIIASIFLKNVPIDQRRLNMALYNNKFASVMAVLIDAKADPNTTLLDGVRTPILFQSNEKKIRALLDNGANPNAVDQKGNNILFQKSLSNNLFSMFLVSGGDPKHQNKKCQTFLFYQQSKKTVKLAIDIGVNPLLKSTQGKYCLFHWSPREQELVFTTRSHPFHKFPQLFRSLLFHPQISKRMTRKILDENRFFKLEGKEIHPIFCSQLQETVFFHMENLRHDEIELSNFGNNPKGLLHWIHLTVTASKKQLMYLSQQKFPWVKKKLMQNPQIAPFFLLNIVLYSDLAYSCFQYI